MDIAIGNRVVVSEVRRQIFPKWLVLTDLETLNGRLLSGIVKYIENTKTTAGTKAANLESAGIQTALIHGSTENISVGEFFVE